MLLRTKATKAWSEPPCSCVVMLIALIAAAAALAFTEALCPKHYELWQNGLCYRALKGDELHWIEARSACEDDDARLPSLHSDVESANLWAAAHNHSKTFWLGLKCNDDSGKKYVWTDGTPIDYSPASLAKCYPDYSVFYYQSGADKWKAGNINDVFHTICVKDHVGDTACEDFEPSLDRTCIQASSDTQTATRAEDACGGHGAHLVSIQSADENSYLRRVAISKGITDRMHIGLRQTAGAQFNFSWTDGSPMAYANFKNGFPNINRGSCFAMDVTDGTWYNEDCVVFGRFICERPSFINASRPVAPSTCPQHALVTAGSELFSPNYPLAIPNNECSYMLSAPGQRVKISTLTFELNACCASVRFQDPNTLQIVATWTGALPPDTTLTSTGNALNMYYASTDGSGVRGFHLRIDGV